MLPKISFILPCYNVAPYVGRCIESIENQDIPQSEYEIICVDDCSADNTVEVIRQYQQLMPNIVLIQHETNKTSGGARNTGIESAKGEYIWFVDPDDMIRPNVLRRLYACVSSLDLEILMFNIDIRHEDQIIEHRIVHHHCDEVLSGVDYIANYAGRRGIYCVTAIYESIYKRSFLLERHLRYPKMKAGEDIIFAWKCMLEVQRCSAIEDSCYLYIRRLNSVTGHVGKLNTIVIISRSVLYACELQKILNQYTHVKNGILKGIRQEQQLALNGHSHDIIYANSQEQNTFYRDIQKRKEQIDSLSHLMNRKTKNIFHYQWPKFIWLFVVWGYRLHDAVKRPH